MHVFVSLGVALLFLALSSWPLPNLNFLFRYHWRTALPYLQAYGITIQYLDGLNDDHSKSSDPS